jgi:hypothetical protein
MLERSTRGRSAVRSTACVVVALVAAGCSSSTGTTAAPSDSTGKAAETVTFTGRAPEQITPPPAEGKGMNLPQPAAATPDGYVTEELLVGGKATSFDSGATPDDGHWTATPGKEADYRTRVIVRRPTSPARFSGTVIVEWFNVSAIEASPDWAFMAQEIAREGDVYIGVSAQAQGVEGGDTLLNVQVDPGEAQAAGVTADKGGLKHIDPERYGTLVHPGDAYAYDIFAQVGRAAKQAPDKLLGGLTPKHVIAAGESQSAAFMTTFVNAVQPISPVFDGFLIHSRGGGGAPLDGDLQAARSRGNDFLRASVRIRTDLDVPVFMFETETDLTLLGYANARQPDTDRVRTWEVAGLSHADAHFIRSIIGGPRDPNVGHLLGCTEPINTGPQHEVIQAAVHHLVDWVAGGPPPPTGTPMRLTDAKDITIARDDHGIALGGVRHPLVDAPTATISGDPPGGLTAADLTNGNGGVCALFGSTTPFDHQTLIGLYPTADDYVAAFTASANQAVAAGFLLQPDADALIAEANANRSLFA